MEEEVLYRQLDVVLGKLLELGGYGGAGYGEVTVTMVAKMVTRLQPNGSMVRKGVSAQK